MHTAPEWWVRDLNLTVDDRRIIEEGQWLNDKIVDAVNVLVAKQQNLTHCQSSVMAQNEFDAVDRGLQVIYDNHHWVAVAGDENNVFVANSSGESVSPLVARQVKELYRARVDVRGGLNVGVVRCMQQPNGVDCGVFAAAFLFEWACHSLVANRYIIVLSCVYSQETFAYTYCGYCCL